MKYRAFLSIACWLCLCGLSAAQDVKERARALLLHAQQLSDIRSPNAAAFRLKATFSFKGEDLETVQGTYTETWLSDSQWRREIVINDLRRIEVAGPAKSWLLSPDAFPERANQLPGLMEFLPQASSLPDFATITETPADDLVAECVFSKPVGQNQKISLCFDKKSGVLLEKASPEQRPKNVVNFSCEYGKFQKFNQHWFPREIVCFEDRHKTISANVVELSAEPSRDPTLFTPSPEAIELGRCSGKTVPPRYYDGGFIFPGGIDIEHAAWIHVWFVVDTKGKAQNIRVTRSGENSSHENVLKALRTWRFLPGKCDGKAMPMQLTLQLPSTLR
jgi:hypothetical protein